MRWSKDWIVLYESHNLVALTLTGPDLSDLLPKKNQKVLIKIDEMADVVLNLANFAQHTLLTLAPPSGYPLNLKALIKLSKVS